MIDNTLKNTYILGLIDPDTLEEYGTVSSVSGKGKPAPPPAPDLIYPDTLNDRWDPIDAGAGDDMIDARQTALVTQLYGGLGNDTIYGGSYQGESSWPYAGPEGYVDGDFIDGGAGRDFIDAGPGDDVVVYDVNDSRVEGDGGFDTLDASDAVAVKGKGVTIDLSSTRDAFSGFEGILGSAYADTLSGNEASNYIDGGAGADTIRLGYGFDAATYDPNDVLVDGGYDVDTIFGAFWSSETSTGMTINLATSTQWINFENVVGSEYGDTLTGNAQSNNITGEQGMDLIRGGAGTDYLSGGEDVDSIYGDEGNDQIQGDGGSDRLYGGAGDDEIHGGDGNDAIYGGANNDVLYGENGINTMQGEDGNDTIYGGSDRDLIYGGAGVDELAGYGGNDFISGGAGADTVDSGYGNDTVEYDPLDTYTDVSGIDTIDANASIEGVSIDLAQIDDGAFERVIGSDFEDVLTGPSDVSNVLRGGAGADQLNGGDDVDTYLYATVSDSFINNDDNPAAGFDKVISSMGDIFDFAEGVAGVVTNPLATGQAMAEAGQDVLGQLTAAFQSYLGGTTVTTVTAALMTFTDSHTFLVVDSDANGAINEFDQVIELVGVGPSTLWLAEDNVQIMGLMPS